MHVVDGAIIKYSGNNEINNYLISTNIDVSMYAHKVISQRQRQERLVLFKTGGAKCYVLRSVYNQRRQRQHVRHLIANLKYKGAP